MRHLLRPGERPILCRMAATTLRGPVVMVRARRAPCRVAASTGGRRSGSLPGRSLLRVLARLGRAVRTRLDPPKVRLVYDPAYERAMAGVPLDPLRADRVLAFLANERLVRREEIELPRPAAMKNIVLVHTPEYVGSLQRADTLTAILGTSVDEREAEQVLDLQRLMAGGTIEASRLALASHGVAVNMGGGFHHAEAGRGMGFCVFNDVAIAIARLRDRGFVEKILVVDLDLHDGNGTRAIFAADSSVHTLSIHNDHWGPTEGVAADLDRPRRRRHRRDLPRHPPEGAAAGLRVAPAAPGVLRRRLRRGGGRPARQLEDLRRRDLRPRPLRHRAGARPAAYRWSSSSPAATATAPGATRPATLAWLLRRQRDRAAQQRGAHAAALPPDQGAGSTRCA